MNNYNNDFLDLMDEINNLAKDRGFVNGKDWAKLACEKGNISYSAFQTYDKLHSLRVAFAHGHARDISISYNTYKQAISFKTDLRNSSLRKTKTKKYVDVDHFRYNEHPDYIKEFNWEGYCNIQYYFRFLLRWEYQSRAFSDGTSYKGYGYSIYVLESPYKNWCRENSRKYDFHFYDPDPYATPTICWNLNITSFQQANGIMLEWAKNYKRILDILFQGHEIDENKLKKASLKRGIIPSDSFRWKKEKLYIKRSVYNEIMNTLGKEKPEMGGMLGWDIDDKSIDYFILDNTASTNEDTYTPNVDVLNDIINGEWAEKGINLAGFIHSHPGNGYRLSKADINYGLKIIKSFDLEFVILPIVLSSYEARRRIFPYIVTKEGKVISCDLKIYENSKDINIDKDINEEDQDKIAKLFSQMSGISCMTKKDVSKEIIKEEITVESNYSSSPIFARISKTINLNRLSQCAIIGVGVGGARSFYEDMARMGVGNIYLIDGDSSDLPNIASQNGFLSEVGHPKVEVVKKRILDINDKCCVYDYNFMLDEKISDEWLYENIISKYAKKDILLCASTDDFFAQKRCQEICSKFQIPYLASGHHQYGETSEIIYWYPGISPHDSEYILQDRYKAYENGHKNQISSEGSPIFNTTRLNALCEKIALGILCYPDEKYGKTRFSSFLKYHPSQNYILIRQQDLSLKDNPLNELFSSDNEYIYDDVIWLNPETIIEGNKTENKD